MNSVNPLLLDALIRSRRVYLILVLLSLSLIAIAQLSDRADSLRQARDEVEVLSQTHFVDLDPRPDRWVVWGWFLADAIDVLNSEFFCQKNGLECADPDLQAELDSLHERPDRVQRDMTLEMIRDQLANDPSRVVANAKTDSLVARVGRALAYKFPPSSLPLSTGIGPRVHTIAYFTSFDPLMQELGLRVQVLVYNQGPNAVLDTVIGIPAEFAPSPDAGEGTTFCEMYPEGDTTLPGVESAMFSRLLPYWHDLKTLTPEGAASYLDARITAMTRTTKVFGIDIDQSAITLVGPLAVEALLVILWLLLVHIGRFPHIAENQSVYEQFAWVVLFPNPVGPVTKWLTVMVLPVGSCIALVLRFQQSLEPTLKLVATALAVIIGATGVFCCRRLMPGGLDGVAIMEESEAEPDVVEDHPPPIDCERETGLREPE